MRFNPAAFCVVFAISFSSAASHGGSPHICTDTACIAQQAVTHTVPRLWTYLAAAGSEWYQEQTHQHTNATASEHSWMWTTTSAALEIVPTLAMTYVFNNPAILTRLQQPLAYSLATFLTSSLASYSSEAIDQNFSLTGLERGSPQSLGNLLVSLTLTAAAITNYTEQLGKVWQRIKNLFTQTHEVVKKQTESMPLTFLCGQDTFTSTWEKIPAQQPQTFSFPWELLYGAVDATVITRGTHYMSSLVWPAIEPYVSPLLGQAQKTLLVNLAALWPSLLAKPSTAHHHDDTCHHEDHEDHHDHHHNHDGDAWVGLTSKSDDDTVQCDGAMQCMIENPYAPH